MDQIAPATDAFEFARIAEPRLRLALGAAYGFDLAQEATADALAFAWEHRDRVLYQGPMDVDGPGYELTFQSWAVGPGSGGASATWRRSDAYRRGGRKPGTGPQCGSWHQIAPAFFDQFSLIRLGVAARASVRLTG
jgi:hypothetical protein